MNRVRLSCCCCSCCSPLAFFSVVFLVAKKDLRLFVRLFHAGERLAYANSRLPQPHAPIHARLFKLPYRGSSSKVASLTVRRSVSLPFPRHFVSTEYRANFCQTSMEPQNACSCRNRRRSTSWNANVSQSTFRFVTSLRKLENENHNGELSRGKYWSIVIETRRLIELKLVCRSVVRSTRLFQSSPDIEYLIPDDYSCLLRESRRWNWNLSNASGTPAFLPVRNGVRSVRKSLHGYLDAQEKYFVVFLVRSISPRSGSLGRGAVGQKKKRNACVYVCTRIREHTLPDTYYKTLAATRDPSILREKKRKK